MDPMRTTDNTPMLSPNPSKRLYRSNEHRMIAGVAGGIAEYFNVDPTIVRVAWVLGGFVMMPIAPLALVLYVVLALIIPPRPFNA